MAKPAGIQRGVTVQSEGQSMSTSAYLSSQLCGLTGGGHELCKGECIVQIATYYMLT